MIPEWNYGGWHRPCGFKSPNTRFHPFPRLPCNAARTLILFEITGSVYVHNPNVEGSKSFPVTKIASLLAFLPAIPQLKLTL